MKLSKQNMRGVTLIELMVTLAVLAVILTMAIPSFTKFRQRSALRGAADQVASFWTNARFEALKRNERVKVGLIRSDDSTFYLCAAPASSNTDDAAIAVADRVAQCTYGVYPSEISEWKRMIAPASAGKNGGAFAVIDPKRGSLGAPGQAGFWELRSPAGDSDYRLRVNVDLFGRVAACEPAAATSDMPQFASRQCN
ncbi:MAG: prepilin-type N-terminal cleavage/methylation domain-containing protein [Arenimonas sp.]|nr:prepilin-type N-terminal cleavage/methylation domain-containing protein [Arenimonas sp.]